MARLAPSGCAPFLALRSVPPIAAKGAWHLAAAAGLNEAGRIALAVACTVTLHLSSVHAACSGGDTTSTTSPAVQGPHAIQREGALQPRACAHHISPRATTTRRGSRNPALVPTFTAILIRHRSLSFIASPSFPEPDSAQLPSAIAP